MKFKVNQTVELINNSGMAAPLGANAVVLGIVNGMYGGGLLRVEWEGDVNGQTPGYYSAGSFRPISVKNQQLLFDFME
jgi:hypothetical protein